MHSQDFLLERSDVRRTFHGLCLDDVIVEQQLNVVDGGDDVRAGFTVRNDGELDLHE